jgi:predicted Zn-dependent protease
MWLYGKGRSAEGSQYLRSAVDRGFNSSVCYAYLAGAEATAGDLAAAERTLATAVRVYPVSVFLLVRHAAALERTGRTEEAKTEFSRAVSLDSRAARGWQQLIDNDIDAAYLGPKQDPNIAPPAELVPEIGVLAILLENEQRFPESIHTGFRARMRSGLRN